MPLLKLHILGIAGTFMGGVAALARELGHAVDGSDANVYPPMSTQLEKLGITLSQGYSPAHIAADTDVVVVGAQASRSIEISSLEYDIASALTRVREASNS